MNNLYSVTNRFLELFNREDLTEEEVKEQGNELALVLQNNAIDIVKYNFTLDGCKNSIKQEIERLQEMYKKVEKQQDKLYEGVKTNMEILKLDKIPTSLGNLVIKKNPASVNIIDEKMISQEYIKEKVTTSIDKTKIKEDIKSGKTVLGAELIETNTRLEIK